MLGDKFCLRVPFFPLNTDGIDVRGRNILIERVNITNFDDAIAIKPESGKYRPQSNLKCTEDILVRDVNIYWSTGLAVGSVHPLDTHDCVKNITF